MTFKIHSWAELSYGARIGLLRRLSTACYGGLIAVGGAAFLALWNWVNFMAHSATHVYVTNNLNGTTTTVSTQLSNYAILAQPETWVMVGLVVLAMSLIGLGHAFSHVAADYSYKAKVEGSGRVPPRKLHPKVRELYERRLREDST